METSSPLSRASVLTPDDLLRHWQGHRGLTRRVIDAFPDDHLFRFSIGDMRPFGVMAMEVIGMAVPVVQGAITGAWDARMDREARPKEDVLQLWDASTEQINVLWPQIPLERFQETLRASRWEMPVYGAILYAIDNEIHHRGQGYVYLRALGIEPPPFYERGNWG